MFQPVAGVQVGILGAVSDGSEVTDAEVDTCRLIPGGSGRFNAIFTDEVDFPPLRRVVVDGTNLLEVLNHDTGTGFVTLVVVIVAFSVSGRIVAR